MLSQANRHAMLASLMSDAPYTSPALPSITEALKAEVVMVAGAQMVDAEGKRAPFLIPPAVALAIVQALEGTL